MRYRAWVTGLARPSALAAILCAASVSARPTSGREANRRAAFPACRPGTARLARVDLFFGADAVSREVWDRFVAEVVTPRFPAGLTSLDGQGQWRGPNGLVRESSRVLVIFHRNDRDSDTKIDAIRSLYKARFAQTSVLRADSAACVGF